MNFSLSVPAETQETEISERVSKYHDASYLEIYIQLETFLGTNHEPESSERLKCNHLDNYPKELLGTSAFRGRMPIVIKINFKSSSYTVEKFPF